LVTFAPRGCPEGLGWTTVSSGEGGAVGAISIKCPATGKPVNTGMSMEPASFYRSVLTGNSVKCPHCGATHIWSKDEAIID
jgi:endogenous inhibitor of DNA gyrase (YacG/DUF329 family)